MQTIVITGGPCAGKTTALAHLERELKDRGWSPVLVPECATALIGAGIAPWTCSRVEFQEAVFELQLAEEEVFVRAAHAVAVAGNRPVIICDRGLMDGKGYLTDEEFERILADHGQSEQGAFARYDAVFHLESAAKGTQGAYTLANNAARMEADPAEAERVDNRIMEAWAGHPWRPIIGNEELFEQKAAHLLDAVLEFLSGSGSELAPR